jgi:nucleoside-diphosphate-sugar epimerase
LRVLVTGGTGFIGASVLRELLRQGHEGVAFDVLINPESFVDLTDKIQVVKGDVREFTVLVETIKKFGITHIVHMASLLTSASQSRPWAALNINVNGTANVLEAARIMDVIQVVFMSSTCVYGYTREGELIDEEYAQKPVTVYGATKLFCEHLGTNYDKNYGLGFTALRFPIVYGPGQSVRGFSAFKEIVEKPVLGMPAKVECGGDQKYDGVYVKDVAKAIVAASIRDKTEHRAFNIGTGVLSTLAQVGEIVLRLIPNAQIEIGPGFDVAETVKGPLDIRRAKDELGFLAEFNLEAGVNDYVQTVKSRLAPC